MPRFLLLCDILMGRLDAQPGTGNGRGLSTQHVDLAVFEIDVVNRHTLAARVLVDSIDPQRTIDREAPGPEGTGFDVAGRDAVPFQQDLLPGGHACDLLSYCL